MINVLQQFIYASLACSTRPPLCLYPGVVYTLWIYPILFMVYFSHLSNTSENVIHTHTHIICYIHCNLRPAASHLGLLNWVQGTQRRWRCSRAFISRYDRTGRDKRSTLNMATRCLLRTVLNSFAGLNLGATHINVNAQKWINVPRISAAAIQCRGLRQGEVFPMMISCLALELG